MADELNIQVAAEGFGSYLEGILPKDVAIACGAFSASMQQVRNILSVDFEKFAQVAASIESIKGLAQINGSDVPVITQLAQQGFTRTAIGSGPDGAYTMSDFFGCMSGLPYLWGDIQGGILETQTTKLINIYNQLFLAVTWEKARISILQPYYYTTVQSYIAPTVGNNPPNPDYPAIDPVNPYIGNGGLGLPTTCPTYYSGAGQPAQYDWYYTLVLALAEDGGGYSRGTGPNPTVTISPNNVGASVTTDVGRNDQNVGSNGAGTFGRVSASINNGGAYRWLANDTQTNWVNIAGQNTDAASPTPPIIPPRDASWVNTNMPVETVTIQHPPVATLAVTASGAIATGGTNTTGDVYSRNGLVSSGEQGWSSPMNTVVQAYITQANTEISSIRTTKPYKCVNLNTAYNAAGTQLTIEQRARFTGISPVPTVGFGDVVGRDDFLNTYPTALHNFVDAIPSLAQDTKPHMAAQTLEAISNLSLPGGQSIVGMMRQERNSARLQEIGVELDNNIPGKLEINVERLLITNGTLPIGQAGIAITGVNGNATNSVTTYTNPSVLITRDDTGALVSPVPSGYLDPELNLYLITNPNFNNTGATDINETSPIDEILNLGLNNPNNQNVLGPSLNGTGPRSVLNSGSNTTPGQGGIGGDGSTAVSPKNAQPLNTQTGSNTPTTLKQAVENARNQLVGPPIAPVRVGARLPVGNGSPYDNGGSIEPGSLAGSKAKDLLPTNLNATYTSGILTPSIYSVSEAIDEVIKCNCDCWVD
jgi:hypothetical protein